MKINKCFAMFSSSLWQIFENCYIFQDMAKKLMGMFVKNFNGLFQYLVQKIHGNLFVLRPIKIVNFRYLLSLKTNIRWKGLWGALLPVAVFSSAVFLRTHVTNHCFDRGHDISWCFDRADQLPDTAIYFNYIEIYQTW